MAKRDVKVGSPIGKHQVPETLAGQSGKAIKAWARKILKGEEPDIDRDTVRRIRDGELRDVFLRPKKKGFYTESGVFIEAFDYAPEIGGDLDKAEEKWALEEQERQWMDHENQIFNQRTRSAAEVPVLAMWEHGRRITEYAEESKRPLYSIQVKLAERSCEEGYGLYAHQICAELYSWRRSANPDDPVFNLTWGDVDCIIKFSRDNGVRDLALNAMIDLIRDHGLHGSQLHIAFGTKNQDRLRLLHEERITLLRKFREALRNAKRIDRTILSDVAEIVKDIVQAGD